jgi:hypothetical protein
MTLSITIFSTMIPSKMMLNIRTVKITNFSTSTLRITTFSITTLSIMTFRVMTLIISTFKIPVLRIITLWQHNETQY